MFDFVRTHQKLMQFLLMLFIIPSFAFGGIEAYSRFKDSPQDLVNVGGKAITQGELDAAVNQQKERLSASMGAQFDPKMLDTPEAHQNILDDLVQKRVITTVTAKENLVVSNATLQNVMLLFPEIAALRKADGSVNIDKYQAFLKSQGMTADQFEANVRYDIMLRTLPTAVMQSSLSSKSVAEKFSTLRAQEREIQEVLFKTSDYASRVTPTPEQMKAYYTAHPKLFEVPEQAKVEYVVLSADAVQGDVAVTEADLQKAYEQNIARYKSDEQRRASHILIAASKDAAPAERAAAKDKAEKLLAEVRKSPAKFSEIAKQNSQDPGSTEKGGDLGFFGKGTMTKPFETAVFGLKEGEISNVVESDFGYHIIQLTGIKAPETKPFAAVKGDLEVEVKRQLATRKFNEVSEQFNNLVYEQADSLKPVADKLKLQIQTVDGVQRSGMAALGATHPLNNPKVLKQLFDADSLKNKRNTQAVSLNGGTLVAARIADYQPTKQRSIEEVQDQLKAAVVAESANALAKKDAEDKLTAAQKSGNDAGFGAAKWVSRAAPQDVSGKALDAIMKADTTKLPAFVRVDLGATGQALYRIAKVQDPKVIDAARRQAEAQEIAKVAAQREFMAFYEALKVRAKVKVIRSPAADKAAEKEGDGKPASDKS